MWALVCFAMLLFIQLIARFWLDCLSSLPPFLSSFSTSSFLSFLLPSSLHPSLPLPSPLALSGVAVISLKFRNFLPWCLCRHDSRKFRTEKEWTELCLKMWCHPPRIPILRILWQEDIKFEANRGREGGTEGGREEEREHMMCVGMCFIAHV